MKTGTNSENDKTTKFVVKDIVMKKKNPQQKLEKYFAVSKVKKGRSEKNFQGFPLDQCRWEEAVNDFVYHPRSYCKETSQHEAELCRECLLRPCLVKGRWDDIMCFCEDTMVFENDDSDAMYFKMIHHAESILVEVFGARYVRNFPTPPCIFELVGKYHDVKSGMEDEDSGIEQPDDELVAGAMDGADFMMGLPATKNFYSAD